MYFIFITFCGIVVGAVGQQIQFPLPRWPYAPAHGLFNSTMLSGGQSIRGIGYYSTSGINTTYEVSLIRWRVTMVSSGCF